MSQDQPEEIARVGFEEFMLDLMRHLVVRSDHAEGPEASLVMSLADNYDGEKVLQAYAKRWDVKRWTPLLLARALADFKERVGGSARVVSVSPEFIELSQSKCEFGEPRDSKYSGNLCAVCMSVASTIAAASGIADPERLPEVDNTIAQGSRLCRYRLALT